LYFEVDSSSQSYRGNSSRQGATFRKEKETEDGDIILELESVTTTRENVACEKNRIQN
jgi:hypothetical protein